MLTAKPPIRYAIVTPVKDEERHIELTIRSVIEQTLRPVRWIIVDDGSSDRTPQILRQYAHHSFITILSSRSAGERELGSAEAHAFKVGHAALDGENYDFIVKLDGDLSFGPEYFERLLSRFDTDPMLGIASGVYLESDETGEWTIVKMPSYHAFGACKVVRRQCFEQIGGFLTTPGWDTVDEIRALHLGWRTCHFTDLEVRHHKREGSAMGALPTNAFHGGIYYVTGGDPLFFVFKVLHRMTSRPYVVGGLALAGGYLRAVLTRRKLLVSRAEARTYRRLLRQRLFRRGSPASSLVPLPSNR